MDKINVRVEGMTKQEFIEANRELSKRKFLIVTGVLLLCILSVVIVTDVTNYALLLIFLAPLPVMLVLHEFTYRSTYKKGPFTDLVMDYEFSEDGWHLSVEGQGEGSTTWAETTAIKQTKSNILLFIRISDGFRMVTRSNTIPKRCISEEQLQRICEWQTVSQEKIKQSRKK